jgi:uncharacterized protein YccT (UPF0319 family)
MPAIKHKFLIAMFAVVFTSVSTFALALPGPTACLLLGVADLQKLADGSLAESESEGDQQRFAQLTRDARLRIESTFGAVESKPIIVFFDQPNGFGPFRLNAYGSAASIGSRTCVMVGPKGQNVDVVAHELMHAEIHHRVGYLAYFLQIPTWFHEGVAMQVDYRPQYSLSSQDAQNTAYVRDLTAPSTFNAGDDQAPTRNYASAKHEVASWLSKVGPTSLYSRLKRMKDGQSFAEAITE